MNRNEDSSSNSRGESYQLQSFEISRETYDNNKAKGTYNNKIEFLLSTLGYAVSYGNIWRFPYMLYQHGGGAFFVPYLTCLIVYVFPSFYLEVAYGQMYRKILEHKYVKELASSRVSTKEGTSTGVKAFYGHMISPCPSLYFLCLISWCFAFLLNSFQDPLPWAPKVNEDGKIEVFSNRYFVGEFLDKSESLFDIRSYNPTIMFSLVLIMAFVFFTLYRGIHSAKYVSYFVVPLPYFILGVFFIKGITLEGFSSGWAYLYKPDWSKLWTLSIWSDGAGQAIFSSGLANNTLIGSFS